MIRIVRPPEPEFLSDKKKKWYKEIEKAIKYYTSSSGEEEFKFRYYGDALVKEALKAVFPKCAYCESQYSHVSDGDIEHFRPKGRVNEKNPKTPGYYWLANTWDNLLLSCMHCNQSRRHVLYKDEDLKSRGKVDQFPLSDESKRTTSHDMSLDEEEKVRLLINPCTENPEEHFEYDEKEAVIKPKTKMAEISIEIYVLQRVELVAERKQRLKQVLYQIQRVKKEYARLNKDQGPQQQHDFEFELEQLLEYTKAESPYAGMARYFVRKFLVENEIHIP